MIENIARQRACLSEPLRVRMKYRWLMITIREQTRKDLAAEGQALPEHPALR